MLTLIKRLKSLVTSAEEISSSKPSLSEKRQVSLPDNQNPPTYQSPSSNAQDVDTSTQNSNQKRYNHWIRNTYSGLHDYE